MSEARDPDHHPTDAAEAGLRARLEAERAGTDYWRHVARQRRIDARATQHRPLVRVAVAVDRRTRSAQDSLGRAADQVRRAGRQAAVVGGGWRHRRRVPGRRQALARWAAAPGPGPDDRPVLLVHLGPRPAIDASLRPLELASVPDALTPEGGLTAQAAARIDACVDASDAPLVCLVGPATSAWTPSWLDRLTSPVEVTPPTVADGPGTRRPVVATVPLAVHPDRPWTTSTAHDLLVRAGGLDVADRLDGVPTARARGAGASPAEVVVAPPPLGGTGAGLACDRRAWLEAGGLSGTAPVEVDLDVAVLDLCLRLRPRGDLALVPSAVLIDARPVGRPAELEAPIDVDGASWRALVDAHGAALVRRGTSAGVRSPDDADGPTTIAITTATPSAKVAARSGDWHFAQALARALRRAGHRVRVQTHAEADSLAGRACDLHVVLRGLEPVRATAGQRHVIWIISHPEAIDVEECDRADLVLVASERYADHLRHLTSTPVEVLGQATDQHLFRPHPPDPAHRHPVTVVADTRGVDRRAVTDAEAAGLRPTVYGPGWDGRIDPAQWAAEYVDHDLLPVVYSSAGLVLNDHWETMRHWGFVSNRIFDVLACGTPVVSDHLPEVEELFGDLVPTWRTVEELGDVVDDLRSDPDRTARRAATARARVLDAHTFDHRVAQLFTHLARHDVVIRERVPS